MSKQSNARADEAQGEPLSQARELNLIWLVVIKAQQEQVIQPPTAAIQLHGERLSSSVRLLFRSW